MPLDPRGYEIQPIYSVYGKGKAGYTAEEIDALVVHIQPRDVWYVIPVEAFAGCKNLRFYPDVECKCARWESYREACHVLRGRGRQVRPSGISPMKGAEGGGGCVSCGWRQG